MNINDETSRSLLVRYVKDLDGQLTLTSARIIELESENRALKKRLESTTILAKMGELISRGFRTLAKGFFESNNSEATGPNSTQRQRVSLELVSFINSLERLENHPLLSDEDNPFIRWMTEGRRSKLANYLSIGYLASKNSEQVTLERYCRLFRAIVELVPDSTRKAGVLKWTAAKLAAVLTVDLMSRVAPENFRALLTTLNNLPQAQSHSGLRTMVANLL